jgi:CheY-like chemotaxis protein
VSNDPYNRAIFTRALSDVSPATLCFSIPTGVDALSLMKEESIIPDLIFIDNELPRMNALDFLRNLQKQEQYKRIHVIVHAPEAYPKAIKEIQACGALAIYRKPYEYTGTCNILSLYFSCSTQIFQLN